MFARCLVIVHFVIGVKTIEFFGNKVNRTLLQHPDFFKEAEALVASIQVLLAIAFSTVYIIQARTGIYIYICIYSKVLA